MSELSPSLRSLFDLARNPQPAARKRLLEEIQALVFARTAPPSPRERQLATEILRGLIRDAEVPFRRLLAARLARESRAPRELIVELANGEIAVAQPILESSPILEDHDLIEVVQQRTLQHQLSVALRQNVSEEVSDALMATGNPEVMRTLARNSTARLSRRSFETLVESSRQDEELHEPLVHRSDLDPGLAQRMYQWVSDALRQYIATNFQIDSALLNEAISESLQATLRQHGGTEPPAMPSFVDGGSKDNARLVRLLRAGNVAEFEVQFAQRTGLPIRVARRAFYQDRGGPLAVACRSIDLPEDQFREILLLARRIHDPRAVAEDEHFHQIIGLYRTMTRDAARRILDAWRSGGTVQVGRA